MLRLDLRFGYRRKPDDLSRASKKAFYPSIFGTRDLGLMPLSQASISGPIDRILGVELVVSG